MPPWILKANKIDGDSWVYIGVSNQALFNAKKE
jgi:hypothetical protein